MEKACNEMIILLLLVTALAFGTLDLKVDAQNEQDFQLRKSRHTPIVTSAHIQLVDGAKSGSSPRSGVKSDADVVSGAGDPSGSASRSSSFEYPECSRKMQQYFWQRYILIIGSPVVTATLILLLLQTGAVAWLQNLFRKYGSYPARMFCTAAVFYVVVFLISLPFDFYSSYLLEHQFALSSQSFFGWARDEMTHILLSGLVVVPLATVCFLLVRKYERGWHLPVWLLVSLCLSGVFFLGPLVAEPLFNRFSELPPGSLKNQVNALCLRAGLANQVILVSDRSKQTNKLNAYVSGISATKRIVLFDNLVRCLPQEQILAVVAHELGHYRLQHVLAGLAVTIAGLYFMILLAEKAIDKFYSRLPSGWGIKSKSDPAFIAVWCIILLIAPLVIAPAVSFMSRLIESEADAYAIRLTGDPLSAARLYSTFARVNLSDPYPPPFIEFWFFSHPSLKHRIDYALLQLKGRGN